MYDELVKRLREKAGAFDYDGRPDIACDYEQAADAIEDMSEAYDKLSRHMDDLAALMPRWIPVTERLPEDIDEEVLVCTENYGVNGLGFVTVATYGESGWLECWERKTYLTAITHWMPLPEPPKEED